MLAAGYGCLDGFASIVTNIAPAVTQPVTLLLAMGATGFAIGQTPRMTQLPDTTLLLNCILVVSAVIALAFGQPFMQAAGFAVRKLSCIVCILLAMQRLAPLGFSALGRLTLWTTWASCWVGGNLMASRGIALYYRGIVPSHALLLLIPALVIIASAAVSLSVRTKRTCHHPDADSNNARASLHDLSERYKLTTRETEVLSLLCQGYSLPAISKLLGISPHTVDAHTRHIYEKTGVHRRDELVDLVHRNGGPCLV